MWVLMLEFVVCFLNKIINIYYLFLLVFIGVCFYYQVYECGVKIIGVIVYYVNDNLDEGLIIMQDVIYVDYIYIVEDMMCVGCDVEKNVLSCVLYKVLVQCVFVYGNWMIIF